MKIIKACHFHLIILFTMLLSASLEAQGYICSIGGGSEDYNDWSDEPYGWIVQKADSGKIIIISDADATQWLPTYFISLGADTAYNKTISSISNANLQSTYDELITAKAIFIRGGDQWDYIRLWKGTKTDSAINYNFQNGGVVAGTSAGAAVLGDIDFSAKNGSAYPDEALQDPFYSKMQFEYNFLKLVPNVLFDSHFIERGRFGRLIAMLYNQHFSSGRDLIGIGIDDRTAFCISADGIGEVMGSGAVAVFTIDDQTNFQAINSGNYTIEKLKCDQLTSGWKYDIINKQIFFIPPSAKHVDPNRDWQLPATNFWVSGSENISEHLGSNFLNFISNVSASLFVVFSHPGYSSQLTPLVEFLSQINTVFEVIYLTVENLNNSEISNIISNATSFVFAGDSLSVLALLKDNNSLAGQSFIQKIISQNTPIFFFGKTGKLTGEFYTDNLYSYVYAAYRGKMTNNTGLNLFADVMFETSVFIESDYYENKFASVLWGMMRNRKRFGVYLHDDAMIVSDAEYKNIKGFGSLPPIFVDASQTTYVDSSTYRASGSVSPRQVVAMDNLRYGITTYEGIEYFIEEARFQHETSVKEEVNVQPKKFTLYQNYPNPFNASTAIRYTIPLLRGPAPGLQPSPRGDERGVFVTLKIYDVLGNEVAVLVNEYQSSGTYEVNFDAKDLSSNIHFYRLTTPNYSETKSMVLLK